MLVVGRCVVPIPPIVPDGNGNAAPRGDFRAVSPAGHHPSSHHLSLASGRTWATGGRPWWRGGVPVLRRRPAARRAWNAGVLRPITRWRNEIAGAKGICAGRSCGPARATALTEHAEHMRTWSDHDAARRRWAPPGRRWSGTVGPCRRRAALGAPWDSFPVWPEATLFSNVARSHTLFQCGRKPHSFPVWRKVTLFWPRPAGADPGAPGGERTRAVHWTTLSC